MYVKYTLIFKKVMKIFKKEEEEELNNCASAVLGILYVLTISSL